MVRSPILRSTSPPLLQFGQFNAIRGSLVIESANADILKVTTQNIAIIRLINFFILNSISALKVAVGHSFFLFAFSLTAFSQDSTPSESKVELADGKIRIVYAFDAPVVASTSQMDDTLLAKTHKIIFDEENSWAQTYSVESIQAAENLLGIDFLISRNIEKYAFNPNKKDTLSVQATKSGKIANTTYTCYRTYNGYGVTIVADTIWDGSSLNHKEYIFPFLSALESPNPFMWGD